MDVVSSSCLPGDQGLVDKIVYELKSQGIFDQFRKECIADVDTKPAYQNLRQRVEGNVAGFLSTQSWSPDMNKNQVREQLRKNIYESGFLELGVERIVDQVVNPKINSIFHPKVEEVVYKFLGLERPNRTDYRKEPSKVTITYNDLLPTDLEAVSPGSDILDQDEDIKEDEVSNNDTQDNDDGKCDEDESPPFEPLEGQTSSFNIQQEVFTTESRLSDVSGVLAHESNSNDHKVTSMDVCSQDSQISFNGSESRLSIITDEITKMDVCDNSNIKSSLESDIGSEDQTSSDKITNYLSEKLTPVKNIEEPKVTECEHQDKDKKNDDKKHESRSTKHKSGSDKHKSKYEKDDKNKRKDKEREKEKDKEREKDKETEKTSKHTLSRENSREYRDSKSSKLEKERDLKTIRSERDRNDKHKNEKDKSSSDKSDKNKVDKEKSQKSDAHKSDRHKSDKERSRHKSEREKSDSDKLKTKERSEKADREKNGKEKADKDRKDKSDKDKSDKHRSDKEKGQVDKQKSEKDRTEKSEKSDKEKVDKTHKEKSGADKEKSKSDRETKDKTENERKDKPSSSRHSSTSSRDKSNSRKEKDSSSKEKSKSSNSKPAEKSQTDVKNKESKDDHRSKSSKKEDKHSSHKKPKDKRKDKDDHYSAKDRKYDRRSTDRDSNDGRSSKHVNNSPKGSQSHSHTHKSSQESTGSSNNGSGDSGNSEQLENTKLQENMSDNLVNTILNRSPEKSASITADAPTVKVIKPKFASNFQEARRIMKIRKQLSKLEKQNQLSLANVDTSIVQDLRLTTQELPNSDDSQNNGQRNDHTLESSIKSANRKSSQVKLYLKRSVGDEESSESHGKTNHKIVTEKLKAKLSNKAKIKKAISNAVKIDPKLSAKSKSVINVKWNNAIKHKAKNIKSDDSVASPSRDKKVNADISSKNNSPKVSPEKLQVNSKYMPDEPDQIEEITPPLKDTVITMASWDALEAKLNQELLKVDYNSYESPDCDYSPVKAMEPPKHSVHTSSLEFELLSKQLPDLSSFNSSLHPQVASSSQQPQDTTQSRVENLPKDFERCKEQSKVVYKDLSQADLHSKSIVVGKCPKGKDHSQLHPEDELVPIENKASCAEISHLQSSRSELLICQETATNNMSHVPDESIPIDGAVESQINEESDASKENIEPYSVKQEDADIVHETTSNDQNISEDSSSNTSIKEPNNCELGKVDDNSKQIEQMKNNLKNLIVNLENVCSKDMQENKHRNHGKTIKDGKDCKNSSIEEPQLVSKNSNKRIIQVRESSSCEKQLHVIPNITKEGNKETTGDSNIVTATSIEDTISPYKTTESASTVLALPDIHSSEGSDLESECKFLVPTNRSDVYLNLIRNRIDNLEKSMAKQQELITRLNNERKISQRGRKRNLPQDTDATDKKRKCLAEKNKGKLVTRRRATLKAKNTQIYNHADENPPVSSLSPLQRGKSVNSSEHVLETTGKRRRINKAVAQRYTSDDLYKPRTNFNNRRSKDGSI